VSEIVVPFATDSLSGVSGVCVCKSHKYTLVPRPFLSLPRDFLDRTKRWKRKQMDRCLLAHCVGLLEVKVLKGWHE
jgi:hypothetical protein